MTDEQPNNTSGNTPPLREALDEAASIFWCNTDRNAGAGGNSLEQRMHTRRFAAAWLPFVHEYHMRRVRGGDVIFMYANGLGVIAVGRAMESRLEILGPDHPDRLRLFETEGQNEEEWRIPVQWLVWDEANPCPVGPVRGTFVEITHHEDRIRMVREHF